MRQSNHQSHRRQVLNSRNSITDIGIILSKPEQTKQNHGYTKGLVQEHIQKVSPGISKKKRKNKRKGEVDLEQPCAKTEK